jgi:hypothetical protein
VKSKRLSANLVDLPLPMAIARLLEGIGVNYIVMMDPSDWARVDKIFVGGGGGGTSRAAGPVRATVAPEPADEAFEEAPPENFGDGVPADVSDAIDPGAQAMPGNDVPPEDMAESPDEFGTAEDSGAAGPPGSSPLPDFLPPAQSFPRSNFTPGLPRANPRTQNGATQGQQQPQQQDPANTPPATFPFMDAFGRPIPVPPGMNQQQRQQQQQNRQKQQQQRQQQQ